MESTKRRTVRVADRKIGISLEDAFWEALIDIALSRDVSISEMVVAIDSARTHGNLSSAIRVFVLDHFRTCINPAAAWTTRAA